MLPFSPEYLQEMSSVGRPSATTSTVSEHLTLSQPSSTHLISAHAAGTTILSVKDEQHLPVYSFSVGPGKVVVAWDTDSGPHTYYMSGYANVQLLAGKLSINGFNLTPFIALPVHCPMWQPAFPITPFDCRSENRKSSSNKRVTGTDNKIARELVNYLEKHLDITNEQLLSYVASNKNITLLLLEAMTADDQEWLIAAEDHSPYRDDSSSEALPASQHPIGASSTAAVSTPNPLIAVKLGSAILGTQEALTGAGIDCMSVPKTWIEGIESLIRLPVPAFHNNAHFIRSDHSQTVSEVTGDRMRPMSNKKKRRRNPHNELRSPTLKVVLCGSKGAGKSTCLRYLINRLLSHTEGTNSIDGSRDNGVPSPPLSLAGKGGYVAVLDCDVGQPEMSVPGCISLYILPVQQKPLLSPPHLHQRPADTSYFLGDLTSKSEPRWVLQVVRKLFQRYCQLREEFVHNQVVNAQQAAKQMAGKNAYNALLLDGSSEEEDNNATTTMAATTAASTQQQQALQFPLVVNTDGFVKHMGAEVLKGILSIVQPNHVLHLDTDKDRAQWNLTDLLAQAFPNENTTYDDTTSTAATATTANTATTHTAKTNKEQEDHSIAVTASGTTMRACKLWNLDAGRPEPSNSNSSFAISGSGSKPRIAAVDLRTLRWIAYFLRHFPEQRGINVSGESATSNSGGYKLVKEQVKREVLRGLVGSKSSGYLAGIGDDDYYYPGGGGVNENNAAPVGSSDPDSKNSSSSSSSDSNNIKGNSSSSSSRSSNSTDAKLMIRNGALIDPMGRVALSLLACPPYSIPFHRIIFRLGPTIEVEDAITNGGSSLQLPERLWLAAFNGAVVGLSIYKLNGSEGDRSSSYSSRDSRGSGSGSSSSIDNGLVVAENNGWLPQRKRLRLPCYPAVTTDVNPEEEEEEEEEEDKQEEAKRMELHQEGMMSSNNGRGLLNTTATSTATTSEQQQQKHKYHDQHFEIFCGLKRQQPEQPSHQHQQRQQPPEQSEQLEPLLLPCLGVGVVRAIDIANRRILLTTPVDVTALIMSPSPSSSSSSSSASSSGTSTAAASGTYRSSVQQAASSSVSSASASFQAIDSSPQIMLCLTKGSPNLTLPSQMLYSPLLPCFPYQSCESTGEGSAQSRTRTNVKRRAQQRQ